MNLKLENGLVVMLHWSLNLIELAEFQAFFSNSLINYVINLKLI